MERERPIIGGMFGLAEPLAKLGHIPAFLKEKALLVASARSGLRVIVDALRPAQIWLPSFLCDAVVAAAQHSTSALRFYEVAEDLNISTNGWLDQVGERDLLILIDYFGFPSSVECVHHAKAQGAWVLAATVGCTGILFHSFFDFNLHIAANAAWFYVLAGTIGMKDLKNLKERATKPPTVAAAE